MTVIYKYPLALAPKQTIKMKAGARILHFNHQESRPCLWAEVSPDAPDTDVTVYVRPTGGEPIDVGAASYVGTYLDRDNYFVAHCFVEAL